MITLPRARHALRAALLMCGITAALAADPSPAIPAGRAEYRVIRLDGVDLPTATRLGRLGFDVERTAAGFVAYATPEHLAKLEALGIAWTQLPDPGLVGLAERARAEREATLAAYHTYDTLTAKLQQVAADHPAIVRLQSAGKSIQGREMWWVLITRDPDTPRPRPAAKYLAAIHGDEVVGMENCLRLIDWLTDRDGTDPRVTRIVDGIETWIMPLVNPDGNTLHQRGNANGVDLNRDFPDLYDDPVNTPAGRQVETGHLMRWQDAHRTSLSANFHGGALVVNYPWDNNATGSSVYSASPDDDTFIDLSLDYSEDNGPMYNGSFPRGITNGADWYAVSGGMQDWTYHWHGDLHVTVEVSTNKWPSASTLETFWNDNRESMLSYLERALTGVRGVVRDRATGAPLAATLHVAGRAEGFATDPATGDFQRALLTGHYSLQAEAPGYVPATVPFDVATDRGPATELTIELDAQPQTLAVAGARVASEPSGNGALDPGETGQVAVTLRNDGAAAHAVRGTLRAVDPFVRRAGDAAWPDLAPGASAESLAPHALLEADAATPPGHRFALVVDWQSAEGSGTTAPFFVPAGAPRLEDRVSTDVPKAIPDGSGSASSRIVVSSDEEIAEVDVRVDITHTYRGDLRVTLIAPDGTTTRLHDRSGGSADNLRTWYDAETAPAEDLGRLIGKSSLGTWTLRVEDVANGDSGTLTGWTLRLRTRPWESPVPAVTLRDVVRAGDAMRLTWWPVGSAQTYKVRRATDPRAPANFTDVTGDDDATDTTFDDRSTVAPGSAAFFLVRGVGHAGEGL